MVAIHYCLFVLILYSLSPQSAQIINLNCNATLNNFEPAVVQTWNVEDSLPGMISFETFFEKFSQNFLQNNEIFYQKYIGKRSRGNFKYTLFNFAQKNSEESSENILLINEKISPNFVLNLDENRLEHMKSQRLKEQLEMRSKFLNLTFKQAYFSKGMLIFSTGHTAENFIDIYYFNGYLSISCSKESVQNISTTFIWGISSDIYPESYHVTFPDNHGVNNIRLEYSFEHSTFKNLMSRKQQGTLSIADDYGSNICNFF